MEQILEQAGYTLRKEPIESQLGTMGRVLAQIDLTGVYIKPAVRKKLEELWDQLQVMPEETNEDFELE